MGKPEAKHRFVVYVDEAGDEGFKFDKGSSEWFVLSAVVLHVAQEREAVKLVDAVRGMLKVPPAHPLHFRNLRHERRLPLLAEIAKAPLRAITVMAHKPSVKDSGLPWRPRLYFYCTRLLVERVSWLCRDSGGAGGCLAKIVFSHRASTPYDDLVQYLRVLKVSLPGDPTSSIHWPALDLNGITSSQHAQVRGLQIADAVCGSFHSAVSRDERGFTECRYARMLQPRVYAYKSKCRSYGVKFLPNLSKGMEAEDRFAWYREDYDK